MVNRATEVPLTCKCAAIRGVARNRSARTGNHVVCYCADCATFAEVLDRSDALDAEGGSVIFQTAPAWVTLEQGHAQLRCLRLSPKGLHRWYAGCCQTLIGNTLGPKSPFVGLLTDFMAPGEGKTIEDVLGPVKARVNARAAGRALPPHIHPRIPLGNLLHVAGCAARWLLAGKAAPFARAPEGSMRILTREERQTAREAAIRRAGRAGTPSPLA